MPIPPVHDIKTLLYLIQGQFSDFPYSGGAGLAKVAEGEDLKHSLEMILENLKALSRRIDDGVKAGAKQEEELTQLRNDIQATRRILGMELRK
jgi:hypothetical protein